MQATTLNNGLRVSAGTAENPEALKSSLLKTGLREGAAVPEVILRQPKESRDEFLAMVSHELRTPITAILAWIEVLDRKRLDPTAATQAVEAIKQSAKLQMQLVDDLMDYSRVTTDKVTLAPRIISLQSIVKAAVDAVTPMAGEKLINLEMDIVSSDSEIEGDPLRLQQVFINLLSNAIKFTPRGGDVTIMLETGDGNNTVSVCDTGEGINPEFLPFVFDRYRQANRPSVGGGLGLGLTIARHIVELHGGTVRAYSEGKEQGSVFTVQLPQKRSCQMAS